MTSAARISPARLRDLSRRSDAFGLIQFVGHAGAASGTGWLVLAATEIYWLTPAIVLHGVVLVFLFSAEHEAIHFTAFRTRTLNWATAWLAGSILMLPPAWFRCFHLAHHRWTQDPMRDPELAAPRPQTVTQYLWWVSGIPYWRERLTTTLKHALGVVDDAFVPVHSRPIVVREARLLWIIYAALAVAAVTVPLWRELLLLWVLPVLVVQPFLRLYLLAEHTGCAFVDDMLANSRTVRTNALVRRLAWNMPYHVEHHAHPGIPFHALPRLHEDLAPGIAHLDDGYVDVHARLLRDLRRRQ